MTCITRIFGAIGDTSGVCASELRQNFSHRYGRELAWVEPLGALHRGAIASSGGQISGQKQNVAAIDGVFLGEAVGLAPAQILLQKLEKSRFPEVLATLDGDFAIAFWDQTAHELWLVRDRFGVRPLYYARLDEKLVFASQPGVLLGLTGFDSSWNRSFAARFAASHYRTFDNRPSESPYQGIHQLPAAHWLRWKNGLLTTGSYWQLDPQDDLPGSDDELAWCYRDLLLDAIGKRLRIASRKAFCLSGGMDSSSVLSGAVHLSGQKQTAFSTVYKDRTYDESDDIRTILDTTVANWQQVDVSDPDVFSLIERMIAIHDEPVATATWLSHYRLCEQASKHGIRDLFTGLGGDELNAGEYEHFFFFFADLLRAGETKTLECEIEFWAQYHNHPIYQKNATVAHEGIIRMTDQGIAGKCLPDRARMLRYADALNPEFYDIGSFEPIMDTVFPSYLKNRTYQDIFRETAPCCLRAQDRHGAHFGIAHSNPFYDTALVEFLFRIPGTKKVRDGVTKFLLREATRGIVPETTRTRIKKTGWNAPAHLWFSGNNADRLLDEVRSQRFREQGVYRPETVEKIILDHHRIVQESKHEENHMMFLWQLANMMSWSRSIA